ncbi:HET-domain-containing protein, partial [Lentithecium fluviatile CBS 122367]
MSQPLPGDTKYLTLSHCWGNTKFLTLCENNKEAFQESIPIHKLKRTFQDALYVTEKLGFRYIWIDSLCIVQDSPDNADWKIEAAKMCEVYQNSTCNIGVSVAPQGDAGFLNRRNPNEFVPIKVRVPDSWLTVENVKKYSDNHAYLQLYSYWTEMWKGKLFERAWVLQEQLLVRRRNTPIGTKHELADTARRNVHCSLVRGKYFENATKVLEARCGPTATSLVTMPWFNVLEARSDQVYYMWDRVITHFSRRQLSYPSDRLPAIQGIANEFEKKLKDRYMAGLWEGDLVRSLTWASERKYETIPDYSRAPSWSWASLIVPV